MLQVLLYSRTNVKLGIPDDVFLVTDSTASVAISQVCSFLPFTQSVFEKE